jgi:hypothetical protein
LHLALKLLYVFVLGFDGACHLPNNFLSVFLLAFKLHPHPLNFLSLGFELLSLRVIVSFQELVFPCELIFLLIYLPNGGFLSL